MAASTAKGYVREGRKIYMKMKEGGGAALVAAQAKGECSSAMLACCDAQTCT